MSGLPPVAAPDSSLRRQPGADSRVRRYNYRLSAVDDELIIKCLEEHKPLSAIAAKIGCCRQSLAEYIHKTPDLQKAYTDSKDAIDDLAEVRLFDKINQGDLGALMFYMPRRMRHRGYGDEPPADERRELPRVVIGGEISASDIEEAERLLKVADDEVRNAAAAVPEIAQREDPVCGGTAAADEPSPDSVASGVPELPMPLGEVPTDCGYVYD